MARWNDLLPAPFHQHGEGEMNEGRADPVVREPEDAEFADVTPHRQFEYRWNQLQAAIEMTVAVIVLLALTGLLGTGPLSSASSSAHGDALVVSYDRFMRRTVQSKVVFRLNRPASGTTLTILVPNSFLDRASVQGMEPRAITERADQDGISYSFDLGSMRKGRVAIDVKPSSPAYYAATFRVDGTPVTIRQIIWP